MNEYWSLAFGIYMLLVARYKFKYLQKYSWNKNCLVETLATDLIQPIMEIFGNSMTAHNWHFEKLHNPNIVDIKEKIVCIRSTKNSIRKFDSGFLAMIFTSAFVDINPLQQCAILKPKSYLGKWRVAFPVDLNNNKFQIEKCSHIGAVKLVIDGSGCNFGVGEDGEIVDLEIIDFCKAFERKEVLFV